MESLCASPWEGGLRKSGILEETSIMMGVLSSIRGDDIRYRKRLGEAGYPKDSGMGEKMRRNRRTGGLKGKHEASENAFISRAPIM